jgi:hypothetical protein
MRVGNDDAGAPLPCNFGPISSQKFSFRLERTNRSSYQKIDRRRPYEKCGRVKPPSISPCGTLLPINGFRRRKALRYPVSPLVKGHTNHRPHTRPGQPIRELPPQTSDGILPPGAGCISGEKERDRRIRLRGRPINRNAFCSKDGRCENTKLQFYKYAPSSRDVDFSACTRSSVA